MLQKISEISFKQFQNWEGGPAQRVLHFGFNSLPAQQCASSPPVLCPQGSCKCCAFLSLSYFLLFGKVRVSSMLLCCLKPRRCHTISWWPVASINANIHFPYRQRTYLLSEDLIEKICSRISMEKVVSKLSRLIFAYLMFCICLRYFTFYFVSPFPTATSASIDRSAPIEIGLQRPTQGLVIKMFTLWLDPAL